MMFLKELQVNEEVRVKKPGKVRSVLATGLIVLGFCRVEAQPQPIGLSMANIKLTAKNAEMPKLSFLACLEKFWSVWDV